MTFRLPLMLVLVLIAQAIHAQIPSNCTNNSTPTVLIAGDSWAQFMGDDGVYDQIFDAYGFSDYYFVTETLGSSPAPPYNGTAYAISGSEAREWANTGTYPYISNLVQALQDNPEITTVILSIGGNDVLAGKPDGGWYKDMDLDVPGSEEALFNTIETNMMTIVNAALDVRSDIRVVISSYEYPNFDVEFGFCWIYACEKREDLSRDPNNDLITNAELNQMMLTVEEQRQMTVGGVSRLEYDNSIGLMHHVYGDGISGPGVLPAPQGVVPYSPGGNPSLPTLRENFRIFGDPIHLDADGYAYKVRNQVDNLFFNDFRGRPDATLYSEGGSNDGWVDVVANQTGTSGIRMGDDGGLFTGTSNDWRGIISFNTGSLPDNAMITGAVLYLTRSASGGGSNPYTLGDRNPVLDIKSGSFGNSASVQLSDGTASADGTDVGCFHGTVQTDYDITRIDIDPSYLQYINPQGRTQFRLSFDLADWSDNYINYFDGDEQGIDGGGVQRSGADRGGIIYQEKTILVEDEDGGTHEEIIEIPALAHLGVPDIVGTTAPFLDLTFELLLPVDLLHFTADKRNEAAILDWASSKEEDFSDYELQRSAKGVHWQTIAQIPGDKEEIGVRHYAYTDTQPLAGENLYRLKMNDLDGSHNLSDIRSLRFDQLDSDWLVYPNPFKDQIWLHNDQFSPRQLSFTLLDVLGRSVAYWPTTALESPVQLTIDPSLPSGTYYLKVQGAEKSSTLRLVKQ